MEQLLAEINALEEQERSYQQSYEGAQDDNTARAMWSQLVEVRQKLETKRGELEQYQQQKSEITASVLSPDSDFNISIDGMTVSFRAEAKNEDSYTVLSMATQLKLQEVEQDHAFQMRALKESYEAELRTQHESYKILDAELNQTRADLTDVRVKLENTANHINDLTLERDQAIAEAESLRKQIEELRNAQQKPQNLTNLDSGALADAIKKANAAKPAIYNKRAGDLRTSFYLANLLETGEEINITWTQIGGYREVSEEEAARFREENSKGKTEEIVAPSNHELVLEVPVVPDFREEAGSTGDTQEGPGDHVEVVGEEAETFEQEVRRRLNELERSVYGKPAQAVA